MANISYDSDMEDQSVSMIAHIVYIACILINASHCVEYMVPDVIAHVLNEVANTADEAGNRSCTSLFFDC